MPIVPPKPIPIATPSFPPIIVPIPGIKLRSAAPIAAPNAPPIAFPEVADPARVFSELCDACVSSLVTSDANSSFVLVISTSTPIPTSFFLKVKLSTLRSSELVFSSSAKLAAVMPCIADFA